MVTTIPHLAMGWAALKQERPGQAMVCAYKMLASDRTNTQGLDLLIRAAQDLAIREVAVLAARNAHAGRADNLSFLITLAVLYRVTKEKWAGFNLARLIGAMQSDDGALNDERPSDGKDWEADVAFIRFDFPPAQRDLAQKLAVVFAKLVGKRIIHLRPECTIREIVSWTDEDSMVGLDTYPLTKLWLLYRTGEVEDLDIDSLDQVEMVMSFEEEFGVQMPDEFLDMTFRKLVEVFAAKEGIST